MSEAWPTALIVGVGLAWLASSAVILITFLRRPKREPRYIVGPNAIVIPNPHWKPDDFCLRKPDSEEQLDDDYEKEKNYPFGI